VRRFDVVNHERAEVIILEFQSEPDSWMAVRVMQYVSLLAEQLLREGAQDGLPEGRLPSILPIEMPGLNS
jgi:hypothetical protein